jgi:hypothetical protein
MGLCLPWAFPRNRRSALIGKLSGRVCRKFTQKDPNLADRQVEIIRESSPGTQQKIYQTEPFTIATDLAGQGNRPPTAEEIHKYLQIKARHLDVPAEELPEAG